MGRHVVWAFLQTHEFKEDGVEQSSGLVGLLICGGALLFLVVIFGGSFYLFKRRISNLEKKAREMGFSFDSTGFKFDSMDDPVFVEHMPRFDLFSRGSSRKVRSLMQGQRDGMAVSVFDYRYKPPTGGSGRRVWVQTVVLMEREGLDLPAFAVRPRNLTDRLGIGASEQVVVPEAPAFSERYVLRGADKERVRALFGPAVRRHFQEHKGMSAEGAGDHLIYYRLMDRKSADQIESFLVEALALARLMAASGG